MNHYQKRGLSFIFVLLSIVLLVFIVAQTPDETGTTGTTPESSANLVLPPGLPNAGGGLLGDFNPDTGKPRNLETFQKYGDYYKDREQNKSFLMQEWTNLLANNSFIGPVLFYTDMFFAFFNPLWTIVFGMEFSWSFAFFLGLGCWIFLIFVIYFPAQEMFHNSLFAIITGFIVATITGYFGVINGFVLFLTPFVKNIFILIILIIFAIIFGLLFEQLFEGLKKESEKEKLKRSQEAIRSHGEVSQRALEEFSDGGGI